MIYRRTKREVDDVTRVNKSTKSEIGVPVHRILDFGDIVKSQAQGIDDEPIPYFNIAYFILDSKI